MPSYSSTGRMFFDNTSTLSPNQRRNVRFSFGLGTGAIRLYKDENTFGTDEILTNASAVFSPNITALRSEMVNSSADTSKTYNLTVITVRVAPYWYQDPNNNNNTVGLVYDVYQQLKTFMAKNYNIALKLKFIGDGLSERALHLLSFSRHIRYIPFVPFILNVAYCTLVHLYRVAQSLSNCSIARN